MEQAKKIIPTLFFIFIFILEYYFFRQYILKNIIPYYPSGVDQANYLYTSYKFYEDIHQQGVRFAFSHLALMPTTFLFPIQAGFLFSLFGASRMTALSLNFFYFIMLQILGLVTIQKLTQRVSLGVLFLGLILSANILFVYGGAIDFRIDFMALCLYGMLICSVLLSGVFLKRRGAVLSALIAAWLVNIRFISVVYLIGILGALFCYYLFRWVRHLERSDALCRIKNIALFFLIVFVIIFPVLWIHRELLYSYYFYGHLISPEKTMRAHILGVENGWDGLIFYPLLLVRYYVSVDNFIRILTILLLLFSCSLVMGRKKESSKKIIISNYSNEVIFILFSFLVPMLILTADSSKSSIVLNIVVVPFCLLVVWVYYYFVQRNALNFSIMAVAIFSLFFITGSYHYISLSQYKNGDEANLKKITNLVDQIGSYADSSGWKNIYATADYYTDFFESVPSFYYERHGKFFNFTPGFGAYSQVMLMSEEEALTRVAKSEVFITTTGEFTPKPYCLFEQSIAPYRVVLKQVATKNKVLLGEYEINHVHFQVYAKPS